MLKKLTRFVHMPRTILIGLVTIAVVLIAAGPLRLFEGLDLAAYDAWFTITTRGPVKADDRIMIIGIDDLSIKGIGRFPWDRSVYAQLLDHLNEAKVVAFDLLLTEPQAVHDDVLAAAIKQHGRVVLSSFVRHDAVKGQDNTTMQVPVKALADAARAGKHKFWGQGVVNTPTDEDAVVRSYIPVDTDTYGEPYPSLALAAVLQYKGYLPNQIKVKSFGPMTVGDITIQRNELAQMLLNYKGPGGTFNTIPFNNALKLPPSTFKDKIVFVGAVTPTLKDDFPTPVAKSTTENTFPGVEIQATAASTILNQDYLTRASQGTNILVTLIIGLLVLLLSVRLKALWGGVAMIGLLGVYLGGVYYAFVHYRFWLDSVTQASAAMLVYTAATVDSYLKEVAEKRRVRNLFGRYVSHNVVNELLKNPEMLEMGGKRFSVTILFSDIRGFTSFSESRDPQEVMGRINEYCKEMVDIIYKNGGTLDKYMGDGIMAYFGAPIPFPDHAERAVRCALQMREAMKILHERWKAAGMQTFKIGVGLNSGDVIAGNVGHPERMEYSLIGSAVNLASRLESMTKEYAKSEYGGIVFSIHTYAMAPKMMEEIQPHDLGEVEVRGMVQKQHIYTI